MLSIIERRLCSAVCATLVLAFLNGLQARCQTTFASGPATAASRLTEPIDENARVAIKGTIHPLAKAANDRGEVPESLPLERIHMVLRRSDSQEQALHQLIRDMHTPGSASYHKWLTPEEFGRQFGPSDNDIATVESWLQSHGFAVKQVTPGKQTIEFSGNAGQFHAAFHAAIHSYQVNGQTHFANAGDPDIPAALAPVVGGFVSLNNFPVKSYVRVLGKASYQPKTHQTTPQWTDGNAYNLLLAPADFAVQYDLNPLYQSGANGAGQSVAIVNESNIDIEQVNQFRSIFGLPPNPPQIVIDGNDPGIDGINDYYPNYASVEAYLDVEWSGAVAPGATIYLVIAQDSITEAGLFLAAEHAVYSNIAPVISLSFGGCEQDQESNNSFMNSLWEQAAAQGITVMVSSGDSGSSGCEADEYAVLGLGVNGLASTPYNVAVGGTDFYYPFYQSPTTAGLATYWNLTPTQLPQASLLQVIPEQPWNGSQYGLNTETLPKGESTVEGGSGGASSCAFGSVTSTGGWVCSGGYPKPAWQSGTGVPADNVRDIPDVSLFASNGWNYTYYPLCASDGDCQPVTGNSSVQITGVGGTSASSPAFAGMMALVNQRYGRQGQADFTLYPLKAQYPAAFHDVTHGTNSEPCNITTASGPNGTFPPLDCIAVANPFTVNDPFFGTATEGQLGTGTTPAYNATAGYNLATGLGTIDANQLVANWGNIKFAATTTTLAPSSNAFTHGTPITISGSVTAASGTPTGQVALMTDSSTPVQQALTSFNLTNGSFSSSSVLDLPGGTYNIWGQYSGDNLNAPSTSAKTQVTVAPESSVFYLNVFPFGNFSVTPPMTAIPYGAPMWIFAQITGMSCQTLPGGCPNPTIPSGDVVFTDGGNTINTLAVNLTGYAQYRNSFALGSHSVAASYSGDSSYAASTSSTVNFTVVKNAPTVLLTINGSSTAQGLAGQPTVLTVQVINPNYFSSSATSPSGNIALSGAPSGVPTSATLSPAVDPIYQSTEGVATIVFPAGTPAGSYPVTVTYPGDSNYSSATAGTTVIIAAGAETPSSLTATASATSSTPFAAMLISGAVTGQTGTTPPSGTVSLFSSGESIGALYLYPPSSGITTSFAFRLNSESLLPGANLITLRYSGDTNYLPSTTTLNLSNPLSDFTMVPLGVNVPVSAGGSATDNIEVASVNGFTGTVSYTCSAATGISCSLNPTSNLLSSGGSASTVLTVNAPSATGNGTYNLLVTGTDAAGQFVHTLGLNAIVSGSQNSSKSFSLTNSGSITVVAASSQTSTLTVTPSGGFTGLVNFSCSVNGNPTGLSCSAPSTTITGTLPGISTLTVSTTSTTPSGTYAATVTATDAATGKISSSTAVTVYVTAPAKITPQVTVTPSSFSISTTQALTVTVAVSGGSGNPTPTGSVTLTGGGYTSAATALSGGTATINILAGSLATGSVTLTSSYAPDSNSSSTYNPATGTSSPVTVSLSAAATPVFSLAAGTYTSAQSVTISDATAGATIYYTTNGTTPTTSSIKYTGAITVSSTETLEAIATASGYSTSAVASATYTISTVGSGAGIQSVSAIAAQQTQTITITGSGFGTHAAYNGDSAYISLKDASGVTWQAGYANASQGIDDLVTLSITSWTDGQIVLAGFTGSYGSNGWTLSQGDSLLLSIWNPQTGAGPYSCTNIFVGAGQTTCGTMPVAATPTFSPAAGTYTSAQSVTISDATAGATIYYTTNGTTPTTSSTKYTGAITVSSSETLEAIATASGYSQSAVGSATYTITPPVSPAFTITGAAVTLVPGATTGNTSTITLTPVGGFTGSVTLTAAITASPTGAQYPPTMSFGSTSPVSITGTAAGTATLTISTTAATSATLTYPKRPAVPWYAAGGAALACILLLGIPARRRKLRTMLGMLAFLVVLTGGMLACGGGGGGGGTGNSGTTPGTYTVTVTGTSGTLTETGTVTLTVQ